jgi:Response regulator containing a CheY-like receiver domain and a GGDEF domain
MSSSSVSMPKVLLIDSNVFFAKRLSEALKLEGMEVVHSTQSAYALTMLEWNTPAAILCATNLREMNAFELPRIVHGDHKNAHIPIIAMGDGGDQALMAAFRAGCDDYVDRRLGPEHVASHLRTFLKSHNEGFQPTQMLGISETALSGNLSHLDLLGVVQMLAHSRQSGALHVNSSDLDGIMFFDAGDISHAESGDLIGDDAVLDIVKRTNQVEMGVYKFVPGASAGTRTVLRSATELMLDALRELDERAGLLEGEV